MNDITKYEKMVRGMFPIYGSYEKRFYSDLKQNIAEFSDDKGEVGFSDLQERFGSPTDIIQDYYENVDPDYLIKQLSPTRYIRFTCLIAVLAIVAALVIWNITNYISYKTFEENLPAIEKTTIEYIY